LESFSMAYTTELVAIEFYGNNDTLSSRTKTPSHQRNPPLPAFLITTQLVGHVKSNSSNRRPFRPDGHQDKLNGKRAQRQLTDYAPVAQASACVPFPRKSPNIKINAAAF
jgi:hypothetical protein